MSLGYMEHLVAVIPSNIELFWSFVNGLKHNSKSGDMEFDNLTESKPDNI